MSQYHTEENENSQSISGLIAQAGVFSVYKNSGETLAMLVRRFRSEQNISEETPITYAGRLDPMAEGLVILLVGEMCKFKDEYLGFDKTYEFEVLFGVSTDTFDMLGLISDHKEVSITETEILEKLEIIKKIQGFSYPPYSSKPVDGVPLFSHARAGTLPEEMPTMKGQIKNLVLKSFKETNLKEALEEKIEILKTVVGDFRQEEILKGWESFLKESGSKKCFLARFEATVTSGVYIRTIATMFGVPTLAYNINRIKIG